MAGLIINVGQYIYDIPEELISESQGSGTYGTYSQKTGGKV